MIRCIVCQGRGQRWTGWSWVQCLDCGGTGRVKHCVACNGTGKLWLGGSEYTDCPACPNSNGSAVTRKRYVVMSGVKFERVPIRPS